MREVVPGVTVAGIVLAHGSPLAPAKVRPPKRIAWSWGLGFCCCGHSLGCWAPPGIRACWRRCTVSFRHLVPARTSFETCFTTKCFSTTEARQMRMGAVSRPRRTDHWTRFSKSGSFAQVVDIAGAEGPGLKHPGSQGTAITRSLGHFILTVRSQECQNN